MTTNFLADEIITAIVIITLELADKQIEKGHIRTISTWYTPKGTVHKTA